MLSRDQHGSQHRQYLHKVAMHSPQYLELDTVIIMFFDDCGPFKLNETTYIGNTTHTKSEIKWSKTVNYIQELTEWAAGIVCAWVLTPPKPWETKKQN